MAKLIRWPKVIRLAIENPNYEFTMCTVQNSVVTKASVYEPIVIQLHDRVWRDDMPGKLCGECGQDAGWKRQNFQSWWMAERILKSWRFWDQPAPLNTTTGNKQSPPPPFIPHRDFYVSGNTTISNSICSVYTAYRLLQKRNPQTVTETYRCW